MHNIRETLDLAHRVLSEARIDHALIGGLALGEHGAYRVITDIDLLIEGSFMITNTHFKTKLALRH